MIVMAQPFKRVLLLQCRAGCRTLDSRRGTASQAAVRVRFAPSPTGFLHLGGLRTALYNYLFARANGGKFVLRIEDTDQTRLVPGAAENLNRILEWVGITPDESPFAGGDFGPYFQSHRLQAYQDKIKVLLKSGHAYRCFCSDKRLELIRRDAMRSRQIPKYDNRCRSFSESEVQQKINEGMSYAVRFKLDPDPQPFEDLIYGPIHYDVAQHEGDPVILKTDGFPTYHFANVVDDHLMEISHVLRGVEWQMSTPKHLLMYRAFGWKPPLFAHLPLIMNSDGTKLSKRQGDCHIESIKNAGYFPEAVLNFVTTIGGGFGKTEDLNLITFEEMLNKFSIDKINTNSCRMDMRVLEELNKRSLIRRLGNSDQVKSMVATIRELLRSKFRNKIREEDFASLDDAHIGNILNMYKDRLTVLEDLTSDGFLYLWFPPAKNETLLSETNIPSETLLDVVDEFSKLSDTTFNRDTISAFLHKYVKSKSWKTAKFMRFLRLAISGSVEGPPVAEMFESLGRSGSIRRLTYSQHMIKAARPSTTG